jgi:hypothetical protein
MLKVRVPGYSRVWVRSRQRRLYGCGMGIPRQTGIAGPRLLVKAAVGG